MLNDRSDKHDEPGESEYHFSDDDVSYEVEPETAKSVSTAPKESILNRLTRSKRMIISLVVFVVLVFVVYKMVAPSTTNNNLGPITPVTNANQPMQPAPMTAASQQTAQAPSTVPPTDMGLAQQQPPTMTEPSMTPPAAPDQTMTAQPMAAAPTQPGAVPPAQMAPTQPAMTNAGAPLNPPPAIQQPVQQQTVPTNGMPQAPVVAAAPAAPGVASYTTDQSPTTQPVLGQPGGGQPPMGPTQTAVPITQVAATPAAADQRVLGQMQADVNQKLSDYQAQARFIQDQMQALSTRVAAMETQLNQIVDKLTRPALAPPTTVIDSTTVHTVAPPMPPPTIEPKVAYSVQAIIPGRAWLKSDSGETVTVAEGDVIKDLGRVTKIDPYDGIVEVNTGSRTVSISYGNGT